MIVVEVAKYTGNYVKEVARDSGEQTLSTSLLGEQADRFNPTVSFF